MSLLGVLGIERIITDTTTKISTNFRDVVSLADNTQDNIAFVANNTVVGTSNAVSAAIGRGTQIMLDTEVRTLDIVREFIERGSQIIYDIIEIFSYIMLFTIIMILSSFLLFHKEILDLMTIIFTAIGQLINRIVTTGISIPQLWVRAGLTDDNGNTTIIGPKTAGGTNTSITNGNASKNQTLEENKKVNDDIKRLRLEKNKKKLEALAKSLEEKTEEGPEEQQKPEEPVKTENQLLEEDLKRLRLEKKKKKIERLAKELEAHESKDTSGSNDETTVESNALVDPHVRALQEDFDNLPDEDLPENDLPENDLPENDLPENDLPENDLPENDLPENDLPENDLPENDLPENDLPDDEDQESRLSEERLKELEEEYEAQKNKQ